MTTYYVDFVNGADANNGLGPDASAGTNKPWKTITKLLGAAGMASGDTAYLSPAGPFREVVTVAMTSAVAETKVLGDPANIQGFKTSGGVSVTPGEVQVTAYTTNDSTAPVSSNVLSLSTRDFLTFQYITFVTGTGQLVSGGTDATNITFKDCAFLGGISAANGFVGTASFGTALNWTIQRCRIMFLGTGAVVLFTATTAGAGADFDMNVQISDCLIIGLNNFVTVSASGASASKGNGVHVKNSTIFMGSTGFSSNSANLSNTVANLFYNNLIVCSSALTASATGGLITEDYNQIIANTLRTNVATGTHSIANATHAALFHFGQELFWGGNLRPFGMPTAGSPLLGFGGNSPTATDILNNARPSGGASASTAIGAYERANTFGRETSTVRTGSNAISITGPGLSDFDLPVDVGTSTCTVYVQWDATYAGTKPKMQVINGTEAGVADATATATGSSGSWEQLTLVLTPTSKGIVTIRFLSSDTNGGGKMFVDDFAVA